MRQERSRQRPSPTHCSCPVSCPQIPPSRRHKKPDGRSLKGIRHVSSAICPTEASQFFERCAKPGEELCENGDERPSRPVWSLVTQQHVIAVPGRRPSRPRVVRQESLIPTHIPASSILPRDSLDGVWISTNGQLFGSKYPRKWLVGRSSRGWPAWNLLDRLLVDRYTLTALTSTKGMAVPFYVSNRARRFRMLAQKHVVLAAEVLGRLRGSDVSTSQVSDAAECDVQ